MKHALKVLEYGDVLDQLAVHAETELGQALCRQLLPIFDAKQVWRRLEETEEAVQLLTESSPPSLAGVRDVRDALNRASKGAVLGAVEVYQCADTARTLRLLQEFLRPRRESLPVLGDFEASLPSFPKVEDSVFASIGPDAMILDAASPELATVRSRKASAAHRAIEAIQAWTSGKARDWLSDPIYTVRNGRYVLPVKADYRGRIKGIVHDVSASGSTVYLEPEDVLQIGNRLRELEAAERTEEARILKDLSGRIGAVAGQIRAGIEAAAKVDFAFAKARLAFEHRGHLPERQPAAGIELEAAIHPLMDGEGTVPLTVTAASDQNLLITGPNTGGKTVAIRTIGLAAMMAQSGLFPKARLCRLGPFSDVFADIGDEQSIQQSLSTFSGHIKNVAEALRMAKPGGLVLFDELGAGTDPAEGAALAKAILHQLQTDGCVIVASTHYGELKAFAYETPGFRCAAMEFDAKTLSPTYRLLMGAAGASQALRIAERHGIPKSVVETARAGLDETTQDIGRLMEELDRSQKLARQSQSEADRRAAALQESLDKAEKERRQAEEIRSTLRSRTAQDLDAALREVRLEASRLFDELKGKVDRGEIDKAKASLGEMESKARKRTSKRLGSAVKEAPVPEGTIAVGSWVRIASMGQSGSVLELRGNDAVVQAGLMKIKVKLRELRPAATPAQSPQPGGRASELRLKKAMTVSPEIMIRMMRADEAELELVKYLDDAVLAGLSSVRIVHGKGEGILRKMTQDVLRAHRDVGEYHTADEGEGGYGVTIAQLKQGGR